MLTHKNMLLTVEACRNQLGDYNFTCEDVYLSYLPLAHMMERGVVQLIIMHGGSIGMYNGNPLRIKSDMETLKPTVFSSVPRLYNRLYQAINHRFSQVSAVRKSVVGQALASKIHYYETTGALTHNLWDKLVFSSVKDSVGGNVRLMLTGSAPISPDVLKFLRICFCCPIIEGYGQTEN